MPQFDKNLQVLLNHTHSLSNLSLGTMATQNSNNVSITGGSISALAGLGNNATPGRTEARFKAPAQISGGATTFTVSAGSSSGTFSVNTTVKKGDYIWCAATGRGRTVSADSAGTSVSFTSSWDSAVAANTFIIYPAIALFEDDGGTLQGIFAGASSVLSVNRISIANPYSDESSLSFLVGSGVTLYSANSGGAAFHSTITNTDGTISFGGGFSMGNQGITDLSSIAGVSNQDFPVSAIGTGKLLLNSSNGADIELRAGNASAVLSVPKTASIQFSRQFNLTAQTATTTEADFWNDTTQKTLTAFLDGISQKFVGCIFTQKADQTVTNTVAETTIIGGGTGTLALPANFFIVGKTIRLRVGGVYSTPLAATPSVTVKVKYGTTVLAQVTTTSLLSGATNLEFNGDILITCRTTGASGTVITHGDIEYATGVAGQNAIDPLNNAGATTTIDTTSGKTIDVTIIWDAATTTRIAKSTAAVAEVLN